MSVYYCTESTMMMFFLCLQWRILVREPAATCVCSDQAVTPAPAPRASNLFRAVKPNVTPVRKKDSLNMNIYWITDALVSLIILAWRLLNVMIVPVNGFRRRTAAHHAATVSVSEWRHLLLWWQHGFVHVRHIPTQWTANVSEGSDAICSNNDLSRFADVPPSGKETSARKRRAALSAPQVKGISVQSELQRLHSLVRRERDVLFFNWRAPSFFVHVSVSVGIAIGVTLAIVLLLIVLVYIAKKKPELVKGIRMPSMPSMPSVSGVSRFRWEATQTAFTDRHLAPDLRKTRGENGVLVLTRVLLICQGWG